MAGRMSAAMPVLVIYDIADDGTRAKVADCCLDYGLDRIQYSAFAGQLCRTYQEELLLRIKRRVGKRGGEGLHPGHLRRRLGAPAGDRAGRVSRRAKSQREGRTAWHGR